MCRHRGCSRDASHGVLTGRGSRILHGTRIARISECDGTRIPRIADSQGTRVARVAVAPTQAGALLLSSAFPGLTVVTDDVASALAPVRLDVLSHVCGEILGTAESGADPRESASRGTDQRSARSASRGTDQQSAKSASREPDQPSAKSASRKTDPRFEILDRWGLTTLGEVAALPAAAFSARLGQAGMVLQRLAQGVDAGPLVPDADVPRFLERIELEWPIDGLEPLAFVLARLLEPLSSGARAGGPGRRGHSPAAAARRSHRAWPDAGVASRHPRSESAADAPHPRSRIASAPGGDRHRRDRDRSGAGARAPVFAARACAAVGRNARDAHGAARGTRRRVACGAGGPARFPWAGCFRDAPVCAR